MPEQKKQPCPYGENTDKHKTPRNVFTLLHVLRTNKCSTYANLTADIMCGGDSVLLMLRNVCLELLCIYYVMKLRASVSSLQERSALTATSVSITTQKEVLSLSVLWLMSCVPVPRPVSPQRTRGTLGW